MDKDYFSLFNFGGLSAQYSVYENSKVVILPVPYEGTVSYQAGTREAPNAIINASRNLELFDLELRKEICKIGIHTLPEITILKDAERMIQRVCGIAKELLQDNKFIVMLGGEHSLTVGMVYALIEKYQNLSVLQFDAHTDLRDKYQGTKYNHACVMRRISELCPFTQIGIRSMSQEEASFLQAKNLEPIYANNFFLDHIEEVTSNLSQDVYITIDLDVLDPSIMPAVGSPEPGGLYWYSFLSLLRQVIEKKNVVSLDVVELCPISNNIAPDFLAAKLIYKLIGYIFYEELKGKKE